MESVIAFIETNNIFLIKGIVILLGYFFTFLITSILVKKLVFKNKDLFDVNQDGEIDEKDKKLIRDGYIIGKCENIIILSFVLVGEVTGLALIFAAKSLARQKDIKNNAEFFLVGTMVNFTASLVIAYGLKFLLHFI